ncbi:50S ribosomal protein L3 [bacterium]|nr:50S ribosomal protein L3 [bacterium]
MVLFGKKIGMTHIEDGYLVSPVTVVDITENVVAKVTDKKVVVGFGKIKKPTKAQLGQYKDLGFAPQIVVESDMAREGATVGTLIPSEMPTKVHATGTSKGKGFAGVVKRHGFKGGKETHGQSDRVRAPGSVGAGTTPGRIFKGTRMAGRMGADTVKVRNLKVIKVVAEDGKSLMVLKGAIPGPNGSIIQLSW